MRSPHPSRKHLSGFTVISFAPVYSHQMLTDACQRLVFLAESRQFLLYARQIEIRGVDIDNPYYNYIISFTVPDIDNVTVVDYDALEHRIYWSDVRTQTIKRAFINGTGVETVVSAGKETPGGRLFKSSLMDQKLYVWRNVLSRVELKRLNYLKSCVLCSKKCD